MTLVQASRVAARDLAWGWVFAFDTNRRLALAWLAASLASGIAPMALLLAARFALRQLLDGGELVAGAVDHLLVLVLAATAAVYLLNALSRWLRSGLSAQVQGRVLDRLLEKVNLLPPAFFDERPNQDLLHRARSDALAQPSLIFEASGSLLHTGVFLLAILGYLATQSWVYPALLAAALGPASVIFATEAFLANRTRKAETFVQRMAGYLLWMLNDRSTVQELRLTGADAALTRRHAALRDRLDAGQRQRDRYELVAGLAAGVGLLVSIGLGVWWMLHEFAAGEMGAGDLAICFYAFIVAHRMAGTSLESAARLYRGGLFLADLRQVLGFEVVEPGTGGRARVDLPLREGIRVENLGFRYPGMDEFVFRGLNLEIPAGKVTVLTGPNGRGKTTLLRLIARLYEPIEGRILVDGVPLSEVDRAWWRQNLSMMFQEPAKVPGTVRENVELGRVDAGKNWTAAKGFGQIEELIVRLPRGEETALLRGLGGIDLSVGEWQRVALARSIAGKPSVLLLDEPTAALDPASRADFWRTLEDHAGGRLVFAASHDVGAMAERGILRVELGPGGLAGA